MHLSFKASPKGSSDWIFLELLRDPSKKWRVDMYGQAMGGEEWLPLFSKVVGVLGDSDQTSAQVVITGASIPPGEASERNDEERIEETVGLVGEDGSSGRI